MSRDQLLSMGAVLIIPISIAVNFNAMLMGSAAGPRNTGISILYVAFWYAFIMMRKSKRKSLLYTALWSALTFLTACITAVVNLHPISLDWAIPLVILCLTPLYGLEAAFNGAGFLAASISFCAISLSWMILSLYFVRRTE